MSDTSYVERFLGEDTYCRLDPKNDAVQIDGPLITYEELENFMAAWKTYRENQS